MPAAQEDGLLQAGHSSDRFVQMIYTSFDDGSGAGGGWQVKDSTAGMTAAEIDLLTSRASTQFDVEPALPQYPTPDDISDRPVRLMYCTVDNVAGYWHTCDAGLDGSGRPGNVFVHAVLDRDPGETSSDVRPIELWKSRAWLSPYGPAQVVDTDLRFAKEPLPGTAVTRESVIEFLLASLLRQNYLEVLLDAIAAWFRGGPSVILVVEDPSEAPMWIGAASYFMSPGTARRLTFSTHDRARSLSSLKQRGLALVTVPATDRGAIEMDRHYVVLDTGTPVMPGSLGGEPHRASDGAVIARVTPWSSMVPTILQDSDTANRTLTKQDAIASEVGDRALSPMWPLAMAAASSPDMQDVHGEASAIVYRYPPRHLHLSHRLATEARRIRSGALPPRAAAEWENLNLAIQHNDDVALAVNHYVEAALRDDEWLFGKEFVPKINPDLVTASSDETDSAIAEAIAQLMLASEPDLTAFQALRIADLLYGSLDPGTFSNDPRQSWFEILERLAIEPLFDQARGPALVGAVGDLSEPLLTNVIRPLVATSPFITMGHFGQRLPRRVLDWLFAEYVVPVDILAESQDQVAALYAELVFDKVMSPQSGPEERRAMLQLAELVIRGFLADSAILDSEIRDEVIRLAWNAELSAESAVRIVARFGDRTPPGIFEYCLLFSERNDAVDSVIHFCYEQRYAYPCAPASKLDHDQHAVVWAAIRNTEVWATIDGLSELLENYFSAAIGALPRIPNNGFASDLLINMSVLLAAAQARDLPSGTGLNAVQTVLLAEAHASAVVSRVAELVASGSISIDSIVALSVLGQMRPEHTDSPSWLGAVVDELVASGLYYGPVDVLGIRDALWSTVKTMAAEDAERMFLTYREVGASWLNTHRISSVERRPLWLDQ